MEHETGTNDEVGDPAQAFENLRAEVSAMRRAVAALPRTLAANQPPPPHDYRADIGKVALGLGGVVGRLDDIEKHPALRLTPEAFGQAITRAGTTVMSEAGQKLDNAALDHDRARGELVDMVGTLRGRGQQRRALCWTGGVALVVGVILSPFVAGVLPFGLNTRVAALVMTTDRWDAGWALLRAGDSAGWQDAAAGIRLVQANRDALVACQQAAATAGRDQRCIVIVKAPVGQ
jgi:Family of unknown function (DUF6118)